MKHRRRRGPAQRVWRRNEMLPRLLEPLYYRAEWWPINEPRIPICINTVVTLCRLVASTSFTSSKVLRNSELVFLVFYIMIVLRKCNLWLWVSIVSNHYKIMHWYFIITPTNYNTVQLIYYCHLYLVLIFYDQDC